MEKIAQIEYGISYLGDKQVAQNISLQLNNAKKDLKLAYLSPSKFREYKSNTITVQLAEQVSHYIGNNAPNTLTRKLNNIQHEIKQIIISHEDLYRCNCTNDSIMYEDELTHTLICPNCGKIIDMKMDSHIPKVRSTSSGANRGKSLEVVYESLCMIQGLPPHGPAGSSDNININPLPGTNDYKIIMEKLAKDYPNKAITLDNVRHVIIELSKRRHLKWAYYLYCAYVQQGPYLLTEEEILYFNQYYNHVLDLITTTPITSNQHIPHCLMIIYRLIDMCPIMSEERRNKYLHIIHKPKRETIIKFEQNFWIPICKESVKTDLKLICYNY